MRILHNQHIRPVAITPSPTDLKWLVLLCAVLILPIAGQCKEATVALVDFDMVDTSLQGSVEGKNKADLARLERIEAQVSRQIDDSKYFKVVGGKAAARISEQLQKNQVYLHDCNGCEMRVGKAVGADYVLVGWVQKVSLLILNLNMVLREVPSDKDIVASSVDMRGDTNEAWSRAATYLLDNYLFPDYAKLLKKEGK